MVGGKIGCPYLCLYDSTLRNGRQCGTLHNVLSRKIYKLYIAQCPGMCYSKKEVIQMAYKDKSNAIKYNNEYNSKAYDRINFTLPKGEKDIVRAAAEKAGQSVNAYIAQALAERMARDGFGFPGPTDFSI